MKGTPKDLPADADTNAFVTRIEFEVFAQAYEVFGPLDFTVEDTEDLQRRITGIFDTANIVKIEQVRNTDPERFRKSHFILGTPFKINR